VNNKRRAEAEEAAVNSKRCQKLKKKKTKNKHKSINPKFNKTEKIMLLYLLSLPEMRIADLR